MRLSLFLIPLALAGCGAKSVPAVSVPRPPADRLVCPDEPVVPPDPVTDEANGEYLMSLRKAWQGCHEDVDWLRVWHKALEK